MKCQAPMGFPRSFWSRRNGTSQRTTFVLEGLVLRRSPILVIEGKSIVFPIFEKDLSNDHANHKSCFSPSYSQAVQRAWRTNSRETGWVSCWSWMHQSNLHPLTGVTAPFTFQRPMITFLDVSAIFYSVDRSAKYHCLLRNGVAEKHMSALKQLDRLPQVRSVIAATFHHPPSSPVEYHKGVPYFHFFSTFIFGFGLCWRLPHSRLGPEK